MQKIAVNKKATYNFEIIEKYEAGIVLTGTEVKSLRVNTGSIKEAFITEKNKEYYEQIIDDATDKIESFIQKTNSDNQIQ